MTPAVPHHIKETALKPIDFQDRVARLASHCAELGLDAYVGTRVASLHWINGAFMPWRGAVVVTASGQVQTIYWAMDASRVKQEGAGLPVSTFAGSGFVEAVADTLNHMGCGSGRLGLDLAHPGAAQVAPGMLTAQEYLDLAASLPNATLVNGVDAIDDLMLLKDAAELARLRQAAEVAEAGFQAGLDAIRPGATENDIAGEIERAIRRNGSTWAWAVTGGTEVGAGPRTAYLHGVSQQSTDRPIGADEFLILDIHTLIDLYMSDFALPVFFGTPTAEQSRMIDAWEGAIDTLFATFRPGAKVSDCARAAHAYFEDKGFGDVGLPLFGHGLGTCARTRPFINTASTDVVQQGMVVALGCHLYVPGHGGMRLEYPAVVEANGLQPLGNWAPRVVRKSA